MEAIRREATADANGAILLTGLPLKAGDRVEVLITSPSVETQRKSAANEMQTLMDKAGRRAKKAGLTAEELGQILSEG